MGSLNKGYTMYTEAGSNPRGHLPVTWGVYLWSSKRPLADIISYHISPIHLT